MSKTAYATVAIVLLCAGIAAFVWWRPLDGEAGLVRTMSKRFMEDLQFKDFRSGSLYSHGLDRSRFDIGQTLETLFQVKPENLDIKDYRVTKTEVDSTRGRAKVLVTVRYRILNRDKKTRENEMILYWMKRHPDCPVGATCNAGQCHDEFGAAIHRKTKEEAEDEAERKNKEAKAEAKREHKDQFETVEPDKEVFACDVTKEEAWFMNLDSTLRGKKYQNADEREKK